MLKLRLPFFSTILFFALLLIQESFAVSMQLYRSKSFSGETLWNESAHSISKGAFETSFTLGYAANLLEFGNPSTGQRIGSVIKSLISSDFYVGFGVAERCRVELNIPIFLKSSTSEISSSPTQESFSFGDSSIKVHYSFSEAAPSSTKFGFAIAPFFQTPLLGKGRLLRSDKPSGGFMFAADRWLGDTQFLNMNLGMRFGKKETLANLAIDHELLYGVSYAYRLASSYLIGTEFVGRTKLSAPFASKSALATPIEWMLYTRSMPTQKIYWAVSAGLGLTSGYGSSEYRFMFSTGYASQTKKYASSTDTDFVSPVRNTSPAPIPTPAPTASPIPTAAPQRIPEPTPTVAPSPIATAAPRVNPIESKAEIKVSVVNQRGASMRATIYLIKSDRSFQEKFESTSVNRKLDPGRYHIIVDAAGHRRVHEEVQLQTADVLPRTIVMEVLEEVKAPPVVIPSPKPQVKVAVKVPTPPVMKAPKIKEPIKEVAKEASTPALSNSKGGTIPMPSPIVFKKGKKEFESSSFKAIQSVIKYVKDHPEIKKISIVASVGDAMKPSDNEDLAFERADAILAFFVNAGVDPRRLSSNGKSAASGTQSVELLILEHSKKGR